MDKKPENEKIKATGFEIPDLRLIDLFIKDEVKSQIEKELGGELKVITLGLVVADNPIMFAYPSSEAHDQGKCTVLGLVPKVAEKWLDVIKKISKRD